MFLSYTHFLSFVSLLTSCSGNSSMKLEVRSSTSREFLSGSSLPGSDCSWLCARERCVSLDWSSSILSDKAPRWLCAASRLSRAERPRKVEGRRARRLLWLTFRERSCNVWWKASSWRNRPIHENGKLRVNLKPCSQKDTKMDFFGRRNIYRQISFLLT